MLFIWTFAENPFPSPKRCQAPADMHREIAPPLAAAQGMCAASCSHLRPGCFGTGVLQALCDNPLQRTLQRHSQGCISCRVLCYGNRRGNRTTSNSDYRSCVASSGYVSSPFYFNSFTTSRGWGSFCLFVCF